MLKDVGANLVDSHVMALRLGQAMFCDSGGACLKDDCAGLELDFAMLVVGLESLEQGFFLLLVLQAVDAGFQWWEEHFQKFLLLVTVKIHVCGLILRILLT